MGKKSSSYQEVDPAVGQAMVKQAELAQQYQDWYQSEMYPMLMNQTEKSLQDSAEDAAYARDVSRWTRDFYQAQTEKANQRADAAWDAWKSTNAAEDALINDANSYNEAAYNERISEGALADLTMGYGQQRKANAFGLTSAGVDPTSGRYQSSVRGLSDEEAYNRAQAILASEQVAKELGWNKMTQAVSLGQNYISNSNRFTGSAIDAMSSGASGMLSNLGLANQASQNQLANISGLYNSYSANSNSLMAQNQNIFNLGMNQSNTNLSASIANNQNAATTASGYGSAFGSLAGMATNLSVNKMNTGSWTGK